MLVINVINDQNVNIYHIVSEVQKKQNRNYYQQQGGADCVLYVQSSSTINESIVVCIH